MNYSGRLDLRPATVSIQIPTVTGSFGSYFLAKGGRNSAMSNDSAEVLMAGGKYKGMSGKSTARCGYSGSEVEWTGLCDGEMTFKFP